LFPYAQHACGIAGRTFSILMILLSFFCLQLASNFSLYTRCKPDVSFVYFLP